MRNVDWGGGLVSNLISTRNIFLKNLKKIYLFYQIIYSIKIIPQVFTKFTDQATKKSITNLMQVLNYNMQFSPADYL